MLTGPPGAGKTTTARALAALPGRAAVHLHADDFRRCIRSGAIPPCLPAAHAQNATMVQVLAQAADGCAQGGFFVVVDGIVGPWLLQPFRALPVPLHDVVLRAPLAAALDGLEEYAIATEGFIPGHTLDAVRQALDSGSFRLSPWKHRSHRMQPWRTGSRQRGLTDAYIDPSLRRNQASPPSFPTWSRITWH